MKFHILRIYKLKYIPKVSTCSVTTELYKPLYIRKVNIGETWVTEKWTVKPAPYIEITDSFMSLLHALK
jgi:hypothetical protein